MAGLAGLAGLALAACGGTGQGATPGPTATAAGPAPGLHTARPLPVATLAAASEAAPTLAAAATPTGGCPPSRPDALGPFFTPGAPERAAVGSGYTLRGTVRAAGSCEPIPGATIQVWLAGPEGEYGDAWRASLRAGPDGGYRFESHPPPAYEGRPPHIHLHVSAPGYETLVTQHYPAAGALEGSFDLALSRGR